MNINFDLTGKYAKDTYQKLIQYDRLTGEKYNGVGEKISFNLSGGMDLSGSDIWGKDNLSIAIADHFESPNVSNPNIFNSYEYFGTPAGNIPAGSTWTFYGPINGGSGIARNGSGFITGGIPSGSQAAFLQNNNGKITRVVNFTQTGKFLITFVSRQRTTSGNINSIGQTIGIYVDGTLVSKVKPINTTWKTYSSSEFEITSVGNHTIEFWGLQSNDNTAFIDTVEILPSYPWYFNFVDKSGGSLPQGKYILSNTPYDSCELLDNKKPGIFIDNPDNKMISYYISLNFNGRFLDTDTSPQNNIFRIQPTVNGLYVRMNSPATSAPNLDPNYNFSESTLTISGKSIESINNNKTPYNAGNDYRFCFGGSLSFIYKTDESWYLDFLLTMLDNWSSGNADAYRFESLSWSVISI